MAPRVSPTEAIRAQINDLFAGDGDLMGTIEEVGMPDALVVLGGEGQVGEQRLEVVLDAGHCRGVERLPLRDEAAGPSASLGERLVPRSLDLVEDRPVVALHVGLGVLGHFGKHVPADVNGASLVDTVRKAALDRCAQALAAVGDDEQRGGHPPLGEVGEERDPRVGGLRRARGEAEEDGFAVGVDPPGDKHGLGLGLRVHLEEAAVEVEIVDAGPRQVLALPGVELGPEALADATRARAADLCLVPGNCSPLAALERPAGRMRRSSAGRRMATAGASQPLSAMGGIHGSATISRRSAPSGLTPFFITVAM